LEWKEGNNQDVSFNIIPEIALTRITVLFPKSSARKRNISTPMTEVDRPSKGPRAESPISRKRYQIGHGTTNARAFLSTTK
jgi:hypothetical protein